MASQATCPDLSALEQLARGRFTEVEAEALSCHIEQCPDCVKALNRLGAEDAWLADCRTLSRDTSTDERIRRVVDYVARALDAMRQATWPTGAGATGLAMSAEASRPPAQPESFEFLSPPLKAGELGRLGDFRILDVLGAGGMGIVFRAVDIRLRRKVALKVLQPALLQKPEARERFLREGRSAAMVEHDHVAPIYQVGEVEGMPYLAMPLLKGHTLEAQLAAGSPNISDAMIIGQQIALGLAAAHARGLVHRDLKPSNVWLESDARGSFKRVRLLDFGLARPVDSVERLSHAGEIIGTPGYMAPEQALGEGVDGRADLFSLGCVLYEMATGRRAFDGPDVLAILTALMTESPAPASWINQKLPQDFSGLIDDLLCKYPEQRKASAATVADQLGQFRRRLLRENANHRSQAAAPGGKQSSAPGIRPIPGPVSSPKTLGKTDNVQRNWLKYPGINRRVSSLAAAIVFVGALGFVMPHMIRNAPPVLSQTSVPPNDNLQRPPAALPEMSDRESANWILSNGGSVRTDPPTPQDVLPQGTPFRVVSVEFSRGRALNDTTVQNLRGCSAVTSLHLIDQPLTSVGWAKLVLLPGFADLKELELANSQIPPAGLAGLTYFHQLEQFTQRGNGASIPPGVAVRFHELTHLQKLSLENGINDLVVAQLEGLPLNTLGAAYYRDFTENSASLIARLKGLKHLDLAGASLTDDCLKKLSSLDQLESLNVSGTKVTDLGLAQLKSFSNLQTLELNVLAISDAGLAALKDVHKLVKVGLQGTKVTDEAAKQLAADLRCAVVTDVGTYGSQSRR